MSDVKAQPIRLLDVFVFGPIMIASAKYVKHDMLKAALLVTGVGTILYNGANYLEVRRRARAASTLTA